MMRNFMHLIIASIIGWSVLMAILYILNTNRLARCAYIAIVMFSFVIQIGNIFIEEAVCNHWLIAPFSSFIRIALSPGSIGFIVILWLLKDLIIEKINKDGSIWNIPIIATKRSKKRGRPRKN